MPLFRIATRVASEARTGRLKWQKSKLLERELDEHMEAILESPCDDDDPRAKETPELHKAVAELFASLSPLQQDIWTAFADAETGGFELDATQLGVELGQKHDDGTPIPGGTIRVNKSRAKDKIIAELKKRGFDLKEMGYLDD